MMKFIGIFCLSLFTFQLTAQDTLSLNECFDRAKKTESNLFSAEYNLAESQISLSFNKFSLLPSLSAYSNFNSSFGRALDPITNSFSTNTVNSQSYGISASLPIFKGLSYFNTKKQLELSKVNSEIGLEQEYNDLYNRLAALYIDLCIQQTQVDLSEQRIGHLNDMLSSQRELFRAGKITKVDTLRTVNSILKEESQFFELTQSFKSKTLELNVLIGSGLSEEFYFDANSISDVNITIYPDEVFSKRKLVIELELLEVEKRLNVQKIIPSLSLNGSIGTGFSTYNKDFSTPGFPVIDYRQQLSQNLNEGIGFNLSIPLFNRGQYFKNRQTQKLKEEKLVVESNQMTHVLEQKQMELTLLLTSKQFACANLKKSTGNLEIVYFSGLEAYEAQELTYSELQIIFMEWQQEIINYKLSMFELARLKLMN